jgi:glycosyltransferase involved in cell wall biosynthesis
MKVATFTYADGLSGAGIAALRLHRALRGHGIDGRFLVVRKQSDDPDVEAIAGENGSRANGLRRLASRTILRCAGAGTGDTLSANLFPSGLHRRLDAADADILHFHWIGAEAIRIEEVPHLAAPVVWTLHDEWFYEGLDHYRNDAGIAHQTSSRAREVLDRSVRRRKAVAWRRLDPWVVSPSQWIAERACRSGLVREERIQVVPNAIPLETFRPMDRMDARHALGLPQDHRIIGFGAIRAGLDTRKGYTLLVEALDRVAASTDDPMALLVFGADHGDGNLPLPVHFAGTVSGDTELARIYAAMDAFVCPSLQENFPNTIGEAMACGVPCAAFAVGGIPEMISHGKNGYLATPRDPEDLARGIVACLYGGEAMGRAARAWAEAALAPSLVASQYAALYDKALRASGPRPPRGQE